MGGIVSGVTGAVSGVLGGIGSQRALTQQNRYNDRAIDAQNQAASETRGNLNPFIQGGTDAFGQLNDLNQPQNRDQMLNQFYGGNEYQTMSNAANRAALASAEATGTLGGSTMQNRLGSISAQLGQNYLANMYQQQQQRFDNTYNIANMGLNAANAMGNFAQGNASNLSNLYGNKGQISGAHSALPWQVAANANSSIGNGAAGDMNKGGGILGSIFGGLI